MKDPKLGVVILAAGEASRMGQAKQLLTLKGRTLLEMCVQKAITLQPRSIVTVLGAHFAKTQPEVDKVRQKYLEAPIDWVENQHWASGMGSSIQMGVQKNLMKCPDTTQILILLADQPLIHTAQLQTLLEAFRSGSQTIVASKYGNGFGVPAVFDQSLFEELLQLNEKAGAKKIMKKYQNRMQLVAVPEGAFDVDTPEEYEMIRQRIEEVNS